MKPELRKALEAELDRLGARVEAIKLLLETSERGSVAVPAKVEPVPERKNADGRSLRWKKASPEQKKRWTAAIRAGQKRRQRESK